MTPPESPAQRTLRRRALGSPALWAALCALVAAPFFVGGHGLELVPFALALMAGWLAGIAVVNATLRMRPVWRGAVLHGIVALGTGALAAWSIGADLANDPAIAPAAGRVILLVDLAAVTGVSWMWLGLLVHALAALPNGRRSPRA